MAPECCGMEYSFYSKEVRELALLHSSQEIFQKNSLMENYGYLCCDIIFSDIHCKDGRLNDEVFNTRNRYVEKGCLLCVRHSKERSYHRTTYSTTAESVIASTCSIGWNCGMQDSFSSSRN